jgi:replicative DNA helicase
MLSDLRESGAIEQDADLVLFVYRPEYYQIEEDDKGFTAGMADIIISKHRNGSLADIRLRFQKECAKFIDPETTYATLPPMARNEQFDNENSNTGFVLLKSKMDDPRDHSSNWDNLPEDDGTLDF